jgi:hypothetical protein
MKTPDQLVRADCGCYVDKADVKVRSSKSTVNGSRVVTWKTVCPRCAPAEDVENKDKRLLDWVCRMS